MATANATVMFTDIRGFTARTSRDTREGLEELLQTHEDLLIPVIKHYDGRVVKTIGDAFLVVFESPTNAVLCGVMIQRRLREFNETVPEAKRIEVRVAINSGEVTVRGNDVFGEPVNIAARIEGITEPNEIYFTEATYLTMQKAEVPSSEVGSRRLKGIPEEVKVYRVIQDEDNHLYRAIVAEAGIGEDDATESVGSLSVPQWPPPRGRLAGPRKSVWPLLVVVLLLVGGTLAFRAYQGAHRYDEARAALEAEEWTKAQHLAGELWAERGDDQEAIRILTEAIAGEIDALVDEGDPQALQDAWTARRLAWGNLPARDDLDRRVAFGKLSLLLAVDYETVRNQRTLDDWMKRFEELAAGYADLPGFAAVRADAALGMGMHLTTSENNFWKDAGIQLLRTFLEENPDDRDRGFDVRVRLVATRRWNADPRQLIPYLEEDPSRAKDPVVSNAVVAHLLHRYDYDGEAETAVRTMFWTHWGEDRLDLLHTWIDQDNEKARLNAFVLLREHGQLRDDEADRVLAWILLQTRTGRDEEMKLALDHWAALPETRTQAAVPDALALVGALGRGALDARWCEVVGRSFFPQVKEALRAAVAGSRYASERRAARTILEQKGELTPEQASRSHLASVVQWNHEEPNYLGEDLLEAVEYFASVSPDGIHDLGAIHAAIRELSEIVDEKIEALGRRAGPWRDLQTQVQRALANLDP